MRKSRSQAAADLALLKEIAEEIRVHGYPWLPGSLRRYLKTSTAQYIAETLEQVARQNLDKRSEVELAQQRLNHLRDDMQLTTDALLSEERRHIGQ